MPMEDQVRNLPRMLFISPVFPMPLDRGQHVRIFNLLHACTTAFHVTFISPPRLSGGESEELAQLPSANIEFKAAGPAREHYSLFSLMRASIKGGELIMRRRMQDIGRYQEALSTLNLADFDLIFVERGHLAVLAAGHYQRTIVDLDDLEHVRLWREIKHARNFTYTAKSFLRLMRLFIRETLGLRRFLASVVCSEADRKYLLSFGARKVIVAPNGTQVPVLEERKTSPAKDAVFLGNCDYPPNRQAIAVLSDKIIPELKLTHPDFCVDLIGPHSDMPEFQRPGLNGRGFVEDLAGELAQYKLMVAPLQLGGGTKLKILDAMAAGVPVVTTSVGAEGLDLKSGTHALIADNPHDFAEHVRELLSNPSLRRKLADNAKAHVRENLSWDNINRTIADQLLKQAQCLPGRSGAWRHSSGNHSRRMNRITNSV